MKKEMDSSMSKSTLCTLYRNTFSKYCKRIYSTIIISLCFLSICFKYA